VYNRQIPKKVKKKEKSPEPMMIHLPEIRYNLYLSNLDYLLSFDIHRFHKVILLTKKRDVFLRHNFVNITFPDSRSVSTRKFMSVMETVSWYINREDKHIVPKPKECNRRVLILCDKGVNRSVAAILYYAMKHKKMDLYETTDYIEKVKEKRFPMWNTLVNDKFKRLLLCVRQQLNYTQPKEVVRIQSKKTRRVVIRDN